MREPLRQRYGECAWYLVIALPYPLAQCRPLIQLDHNVGDLSPSVRSSRPTRMSSILASGYASKRLPPSVVPVRRPHPHLDDPVVNAPPLVVVVLAHHRAGALVTPFSQPAVAVGTCCKRQT